MTDLEALAADLDGTPSTRTEDEAESGFLTVVMGGRDYRLRVLTIGESEEWQTFLSTVLAGLQVPESDDLEDGGAAFIDVLLKDGARGRRRVLLAYDLDDVLGGEDYVKKRMTQRELATALEVVLDAEYPFVEERRSVVEAFGMPLRILALASASAAVDTSRQERSLSGLSPSGDSPTPTSDDAGHKSSSPSGGPTASGAKPRSRKPKR